MTSRWIRRLSKPIKGKSSRLSFQDNPLQRTLPASDVVLHAIREGRRRRVEMMMQSLAFPRSTCPTIPAVFSRWTGPIRKRPRMGICLAIDKRTVGYYEGKTRTESNTVSRIAGFMLDLPMRQEEGAQMYGPSPAAFPPPT